MSPINLAEKFSFFTEHWSPKILGELNNQHVKIARFLGEFIWHKHDHEDELFFVVDGSLTIEFRDKKVVIEKNEFLIVPKGVEHKPVAEKEVLVMLFEPASTLNTGNEVNEFTKKNPVRI
jgi:mannose-6-phosphate isomerase-like protein (cupin superfamily)